MRVRYIGEDWGISLTKNKIYECLGFEHDFIRIVDDTDEDYLYDPEMFEILKDDDKKICSNSK